MTAQDPADGYVHRQRFSVAFDYPVHFTRQAFDCGNGLLESVLDRLGEGRRHRAVVLIDRGVADAHRDLPERVTRYFAARPSTMQLACPPMTIAGGEAVKSDWQTLRNVVETLGRLHVDRQSYVVAVGGGSMLDMAGFAASVVHRGVRLVRLPTTTLAQNDAGVGVKNGMDGMGQKNFIGAFAPPFAVINDSTFLHTLDPAHWIGGVAEAFKVAMIADADLLDLLAGGAAGLRARHLPAMEQVIRRCAIIHLDHIARCGDPFEFGSARPLDYGHWAAHKLEIMSAFTVPHGQAVAVGIALDAVIAAHRGLLEEPQLQRLLEAMAACGLPVWCEHLAHTDTGGRLAILDGLEDFREHLGGRLTVTLPRGVGRGVEVHDIRAEEVAHAVERLAGCRGPEERP